MNATKADFRNDPDYFHCEKFRSWMKRERCIEFQDMALAPGYKDPEIAYARQTTCLNCDQGRQIIMDNVERRESMPTKEKKEEKKDKGTPVHPCIQCGEREAIISKEGRVINGLCRECFSAKRLAARTSIRNHRARVVVDFADYEPALTALEERARVNLRTIEQQMLWEMIQMAVQ